MEQTKRKFEKECKECERAQAYFDKLDNDINVTKIDVEKVGCQEHFVGLLFALSLECYIIHNNINHFYV